MRRPLVAAQFVVVALLSAAPVHAQVTTGTIVGTVSDSNGIVPGAAVTIREVNRGTSDTVVTDDTGSYTAPFLTPGTYTGRSQRRRASRSGSATGVILQVNQRARVDVALEVGGDRRDHHRHGRPRRCCAPTRPRSARSSRSARSRSCR